MTSLEIILLLSGIICVAVSFLFSVKLDGPESTGVKPNMGLTDKQKEDIKKQISLAYQEQMDEMTEQVMEKTENSLDKLSNQKIQELSDYSETVLADINKNHTEVMFLYDMLSEKSKEVHSNIRDISIAADRLKAAGESAATVVESAAIEDNQDKEVKEQPQPKKTTRTRTVKKSSDAVTEATQAPSSGRKTAKTASQSKSASGKTNLQSESEADIDTSSVRPASAKTASAKASTAKTTSAKRTTSKKAKANADNTGDETANTGEAVLPDEAVVTDTASLNISAGPQTDDNPMQSAEADTPLMGNNKKEAIFALYEQGKNNVEIARTLGLGVGEVKLVIDLFKGHR